LQTTKSYLKFTFALLIRHVHGSLEEIYFQRQSLGFCVLAWPWWPLSLIYTSIKCSCYVCCFLTVDLREDAQNVMKFIPCSWGYACQPLLLMKAMFKYCRRVFGCCSNPHFQCVCKRDLQYCPIQDLRNL
jgi:hypothetical protein